MQDCVSNLITISLAQDLPKEQSDDKEEGESHALRLLRHFPLFRAVSRNDLAKLAKAAVVLHFRKGETIIREGDIPELYCIILKGLVRVSKISPSGQEFTIALRYEGEAFGQPSFLIGEPHVASSIALEDTDVLAIGRKDFMAFMARNPIVGSRIIYLEAERTSHLYERIVDMISNSAPQRVTRMLSSLGATCGNTLSFTHQEIAILSWTTMETTTRVITRLKNAGIITSARGKIVIKDPERLRIYCRDIHGIELPPRI